MLKHKSGIVDFVQWYREAHGEHTPWGDEDSEAFVTQAETKLERQPSRWLMNEDHAPERRTLEPGATLVEQGEQSMDLYLLLDGVLSVEIDGEEVARSAQGLSSASAPCSSAGAAPRRSAHGRARGSPSCPPG